MTEEQKIEEVIKYLREELGVIAHYGGCNNIVMDKKYRELIVYDCVEEWGFMSINFDDNSFSVVVSEERFIPEIQYAFTSKDNIRNNIKYYSDEINKEVRNLERIEQFKKESNETSTCRAEK